MKITFKRAGEGPPLLLLHGEASDSRVWHKQLDGLSDEFTVIAWDAPGRGSSSKPPPSFHLAKCADSLAAFIRVIGVKRPHVVGLSTGGELALELYRRHPNLPESLVLAEAHVNGMLPRIEVPTLLLYGGGNGHSTLELAKNLHVRIPTSDLVVMDGVSYPGNRSAPQVFNKEIRSFLRHVMN